ncbi:MAG: peptidase S10, partial [Caldimonas sp.]
MRSTRPAALIGAQAARPTTRGLAWALCLTASLAGCGGGGSGGDASSGDPGSQASALHDTTPYSSAADASLASADEGAAVTAHSISVGGAPIAYTAGAGHLTARAPLTGMAEATMFYVAYTVPNRAGGNRPVFYFYNGGPGSASVWLHLGSFAPRRIVTHDPSTAVPQPFQLVDNAESLIDVADLVFVDAAGTGYSEAIAPATNQSFWSVDADAALMRDFIARYAAVNQRQSAPTYLFGESYGTTRSAVLAELMVAAGMRLDGVILQSSVLDYNANCDLFDNAVVSCEGSFPSYGMVG